MDLYKVIYPYAVFEYNQLLIKYGVIWAGLSLAQTAIIDRIPSWVIAVIKGNLGLYIPAPSPIPGEH